MDIMTVRALLDEVRGKVAFHTLNLHKRFRTEEQESLLKAHLAETDLSKYVKESALVSKNLSAVYANPAAFQLLSYDNDNKKAGNWVAHHPPLKDVERTLNRAVQTGVIKAEEFPAYKLLFKAAHGCDLRMTDGDDASDVDDDDE